MLRELAPIYVLMLRMYSIPPRVVDTMELWEVYAALNPTPPDDDDPVEEGVDRMLTPEEFEAEARRLLKQRFAAATEGAAAPSIPQ